MKPLAERMRPKSLKEYVGQSQIVGDGAVLRNIIESGHIPSFILWGPPGVGKTTLAGIIAEQLSRPFFTLSAINSGVKDIRETIQKAKSKRFFDAPQPILFIDEIHRFSKSQQDSLLGAVESGIITLIGATTENPSFEVIPALLSRCQVYILKHLEVLNLKSLVDQAVNHDEYLSKLDIDIAEYDSLIKFSGGDGRKILNSLEIVINNSDRTEKIIVTNDLVDRIIQQNIAQYDKTGELHYDIISAFIKSIRGGDPQATLYYLARMIEGGEDPKFICRRMIISASEDIGMANPNALLLANACMQAVQNIGMPEGRIVMSQCAIYLATCDKSNASYMAIDKALATVRQQPNLSVPLHLRNAPTKLMKQLDYGKGYKYAHDYKGNHVQQEYLPSGIQGTEFYIPQGNPAEQRIKARLDRQKNNT